MLRFLILCNTWIKMNNVNFFLICRVQWKKIFIEQTKNVLVYALTPDNEHRKKKNKKGCFFKFSLKLCRFKSLLFQYYLLCPWPNYMLYFLIPEKISAILGGKVFDFDFFFSFCFISIFFCNIWFSFSLRNGYDPLLTQPCKPLLLNFEGGNGKKKKALSDIERYSWIIPYF